MREIKFRGFSVRENKFVYGDFFKKGWGLKNGISAQGEPGVWDIKDGTIGQYTGLKDKNSFEIYEGDIVRFKFKNETRIGFVEYVRSSFLINVGEIICDNKTRHSFSNSSSEEHEVIGNVYQNKDLLEG